MKLRHLLYLTILLPLQSLCMDPIVNKKSLQNDGMIHVKSLSNDQLTVDDMINIYKKRVRPGSTKR